MIKKNLCLLCVLIFLVSFTHAIAGDKEKLKKLERRITSYKINKTCKDDSYGLIVVKGALVSIKDGSGGIGACLVDSKTKKVVEYGRNRQYTPYFRSDLHAEMNLLNRYEDRMKKTRSLGKSTNPRNCENLVLVTSMEPCPMCLARIINSGIKTVLYVVEDKQGGMATRINCLPPFWREFAKDREFRKADCSPELAKIAYDLFHFSDRSFAINRVK
jgi:tRNA(adenine34) deaminase